MLFYSEEGPRVCCPSLEPNGYSKPLPGGISPGVGSPRRNSPPDSEPHRSASFEFYQATHKFRTRQADLHRKVVDADPLLVS